MKKFFTVFQTGPIRPLAAALFITMYILVGTSSAQEVIATAGGNHHAGGASISWTVGEGVIETFAAGSYILTQGMHQPTLTVVSVTELSDPEFIVTAYPNPATDYLKLHIRHEEPGDFRYILGNMHGNPIFSERMKGTEEQIDMSALPRGFYLLTVIHDKQPVKTISIIKR